LSILRAEVCLGGKEVPAPSGNPWTHTYDWHVGETAVFEFRFEVPFKRMDGANVILFDTAKKGKARIACGALE